MNRTPAALAAVAALVLALLPRAALAQSDPWPTMGLVVSVDVGGGRQVGGVSDYSPRGLFEGELTLGYELPFGLRPELSLPLGLSPRLSKGLRPGVHWGYEELPFYWRAALDWSDARGTYSWRWLLVGAGLELRLTDALGGFVEGDVGVPIRHYVGLGLLARAGVTFRY